MGSFGKAAVLCGTSFMLLFLALSCGGGGGGGDGGLTLTGTIRAPGGTVAGADVELLEVDSDGMEVAVLAAATADGSGDYTLEPPEGFTPDTPYVVRVTGTDFILEGRVTGNEVDVDPVTDAASAFVTDATSAWGFSAVTLAEVIEVLDVVGEAADDVDPAGLDWDEMVEAVVLGAGNSVEASNVIASITAEGEICGTVTGGSTLGLAGIRIFVTDFENQATRARARTAADGTYCVNLPVQGDTDFHSGAVLPGEYTLAACNFSGASSDSGRRAGEFYSAGGDAYNAFEADRLTLTPGAPSLNDIDLQLDPGARITGRVTGHDTGGTGIRGPEVIIREFETHTMVATVPAGSDGTYVVNVIPGRYLAGVRNRTYRPYATEVYDGGTGTHNRNLGTPVVVTAGQVRTLNFQMEAGRKLSGTVTDGASTDPVTGILVYIDIPDGGAAERLRTDRTGHYRIWLRSGSYDVLTYGQRSLDLNLSADQVVDFVDTVSTISGVIEDTGSNPVKDVSLFLYDGSRNLLGKAATNGYGAYSIYTDETGDHRLEARVVGPASSGGLMYQDHTNHDSGDVINIPSAGSTATADMILPAGGMLKMIAYQGNGSGTPDRSAPVPNERFLIRDDDNLATAGTGITIDYNFFGIRTRGDGAVTATLPAGTYDRLRLPDVDSGTGSNACGSFTVTAGQTLTVEFFDGDNICIKQ